MVERVSLTICSVCICADYFLTFVGMLNVLGHCQCFWSRALCQPKSRILMVSWQFEPKSSRSCLSHASTSQTWNAPGLKFVLCWDEVPSASSLQVGCHLRYRFFSEGSAMYFCCRTGPPVMIEWIDRSPLIGVLQVLVKDTYRLLFSAVQNSICPELRC